MTPWTVARQAPLSVEFSSPDTGVDSRSLLQGNLPNPGSEPRSPTLQEDSLLPEPPRKCSRRWVKKIFLLFMSKSVLPVISSKGFIVSGLKFRSLVHFEFVFVYGIREHYNFILLHVAIKFSQHHLLKRLSFLLCVFLPTLS